MKTSASQEITIASFPENAKISLKGMDLSALRSKTNAPPTATKPNLAAAKTSSLIGTEQAAASLPVQRPTRRINTSAIIAGLE